MPVTARRRSWTIWRGTWVTSMAGSRCRGGSGQGNWAGEELENEEMNEKGKKTIGLLERGKGESKDDDDALP